MSQTEPEQSLRPAPPPRARYLLFATLVAVGMGQTIVFAVLAPLGREIGLSEVQVGAIISASSIMFFIASPIWGRISDRWGRRRVILVGLFGYTAGTAVFASVFQTALVGMLAPLPAFIALTLARMGQASVMSATPPAASAYMADITDVRTRTKGMGAIGAANNVGAVAGPAIGGLLAVFSLLTPIWFAAGVTLVAALAVLVWLPEPARHVLARPRGRLSYFDPRILPFIIVGVVMFMGMAVVQQTLAFRLQDTLNLSGAETARAFGTAMMLMALSSLVAQGFVVQRLDVAPFTLLRIAMPILLGAFIAITLADSQLLYLAAMAVLGFGMGLAGPGFMAGASLAVSPEEQGSVAGVASSCGPLGFTIGPLLGTALYQIHGQLPYLVTVLIYIPLLIFTFRVKVRRPHQEGDSVPD
ncbi:MAG: MFS transporter [Gammaproteobacteria bacterium]|nr:MFS transporter [Gammaproteobacteria bacterium]